MEVHNSIYTNFSSKLQLTKCSDRVASKSSAVSEFFACEVLNWSFEDRMDDSRLSSGGYKPQSDTRSSHDSSVPELAVMINLSKCSLTVTLKIS